MNGNVQGALRSPRSLRIRLSSAPQYINAKRDQLLKVSANGNAMRSFCVRCEFAYALRTIGFSFGEHRADGEHREGWQVPRRMGTDCCAVSSFRIRCEFCRQNSEMDVSRTKVLPSLYARVRMATGWLVGCRLHASFATRNVVAFRYHALFVSLLAQTREASCQRECCAFVVNFALQNSEMNVGRTEVLPSLYARKDSEPGNCSQAISSL